MSRKDFNAAPPAAAFIALHARRRPDRIAVICDGRQTAYATLHAELRAMTAALSRLGLPPGAIVAVEHARIHPRLLVMLALEQLGVAVAPIRADEGDAAQPFLATVDLVMSESGIAAPGCARVLHMTETWLAEALAHAPLANAPPPQPGSRAALLQRTSGSTGQPKQVLVTRAMLAARVAQRIVCQDFHRDDRFLAIMHFTVGSNYYVSLACLKLGATVMSHQSLPVARQMALLRPTKIYMLPYQLAALLEHVSTVQRLPDLQIIVTGGKLSPALVREAIEHLCGRVTDLYATNETGLICTIDQNGLGHVVAGTSMEVVGGDGAPVSTGAVGEVRVRGPAIFDGYRGNPAATAATLRNGWWHTGDLALWLADSGVKLFGRRDDMLNFGGIKRATADIEAEIKAIAECDIAVLAACDVHGETVAAVCVTGDAPAAARLAGLISASVIGRFAVYNVKTIPRTPEGKLRRAVLTQDIADRMPLRAGQAA